MLIKKKIKAEGRTILFRVFIIAFRAFLRIFSYKRTDARRPVFLSLWMSNKIKREKR